MNSIKSSYNFKGIRATTTWLPERELQRLEPIAQVHDIIFNNEGEILVARESPDGKWQLPGGKSEKGEAVEETLR